MGTCLELPNVENIHNFRNKHPKNTFTGYLKKQNYWLEGNRLNYFAASETKLDESFPSQQFVIEDFEISTKNNEDRHRMDL